MSLAKLAENLRETAKSQKSVTLDATTLTTAELVPPPELDTLIGGAFQLEGKKLVLTTTPEQIGQPTETQLKLKGSLSALGVKEAETTVVFTTVGSAVSFTLDASLPSDWKFATSFSALEGFPFQDVKLTTPAFVFSTGKVTGYVWAGGKLDLEPGLNFAALGELGKKLAPLLSLVPGAPKQPLLQGPIKSSAGKRANKPDLEIGASLLEGKLPDLGFLELSDAELGLEVQTHQIAEGPEQYSAAYLLVELGAEDTDLKLDCRVEVGQALSNLRLTVGPPKGRTVTIEDVFALMGGRSWYSSIPAPLQDLFTAVGFKGLEANVSTKGGKPKLESVAVTVGSEKAWPLFGEWRVDEVDFTWMVADPLGKPRLSGVFGGKAHFFPSVFTDAFYVTITTDLLIEAGYEGTVKLSKVLQELAPGTVLPDHMDVELTSFDVSIDKPRSAFSIAASAAATMQLTESGSLDMVQVQLLFAKAPKSTKAALVGGVIIGGVSFGLEATYEDGAWHFEGGLEPGDAIPLGALVDDLLGKIGLPEFVPPSLEVTPLRMTLDVPGEKDAKTSYSVEAGTQWVLEARGSVLDQLKVSAGVDITHDGKTGKSTGSLHGEAELPLPIAGMTFDVGLGYEFQAEDKLLWVEWRGFAKATYSLKKDEVVFKLEAASVGSLLTELIRIIEGDPGFTLPAPWNLLEQISLKSFSVTWRLKPKAKESPVEVKYDLEGNNIKLFFIEIRSLGFSVVDGKVNISLDAKLLGQEDFEEMKFPASSPPPAPGGETSAFELDLLALGQRVSVEGLQSTKKIEEAVEKLEKFNEPSESDSLPIPAKPAPGQPYYAPDSAWIVGTRFKVLVDKKTKEALLLLEAVFNDPQLYGLRIKVAGDKAGPLKNLDFEVLYRKVSDTVGVYQIELTLPDVMRHIELGQVSLTLPVIGLDVYTNGNFRVDFGFPANLDFSRSAGLQVFPFLGQGGFYFGVLGSETAGDLVPKTKKGSFDPVIVFGLGLRVGLGKSISEGVFSAELSVTVVGIVEGVLAPFHPYTPPQKQLQNGSSTELAVTAGESLDNEFYYWLRGTVGVIGKVSGSVNFAIISASVDITVQAFIQMTVEAHREIPVHVEAGVSVGITVKINLGLFSINLHFSFSLTVKADFLLGSTTTAPWDEASLAAPLTEAALPAPTVRSFAALAVESKIPLTLYGAPQLTLADWTSGTKPSAAYVAMLYLDSPVGRQTSPSNPSAFEVLARETLLWAVANFGGAGGESRADALATEISRDQVRAAFAHFAATGGPPPAPWSDIRSFLSTHFSVSIVAPPAAGIASATAMPMLPDLTLGIPEWEGRPPRTVDFAHESTCDQSYLDALQKILEELEVQLETDLQRKHASAPQAKLPGEAQEQSLATFIAEDWFALLCRQMLQSSLDAFDLYSYVLPGDRSLGEIATAFPAANKLTAAAIAAANTGLPLAPGAKIAMRGVTHAVAANETLGGIAAGYNLTAVALAQANEGLEGLLAPGTPLSVGGKPHTVAARDTFKKIVAATGASLAEVVAATEAAKGQVLVPLAVLAVPGFVHEAKGSDTLGSLAAEYGVDVAAIAAANENTKPFFSFVAEKTIVDIPKLTALSAEQLIEELHASQVYSNLAGISSRFLLDGLRLPVNSHIHPDPAATCAKAETCGLQSLIGQQVTLPALSKADADKYALKLGRGAEGGWIALGPSGETLPMTIDSGQIERIEAVLGKATPALEPDTLSIAALPPTAGVKRRFALTAASPLRLPAGLAMPGKTAAAPTALSLPAGLLTVLADPDRARPALSLQRTDPGPGGSTTITPVSSSSWAVLVPVSISRIPGAPPGAYALNGTDQTGIVLLERLLEEIGNGGHPLFGTPQVLFPPAVTDPQPTGLAGGDPATVSSFIVQANLSTETNPPRRSKGEAEVTGTTAKTVANTPEEFVRLLWECSIVASGGYYFHYESAPGSPGLPDHLFDIHGDATVQLLIQLQGQEEGLGRYVNAAVLGEAIDPAHTTVFAQSEPRTVEHTFSEADSLASVAAGLHLTVSQLAEQLAGVPLKKNGPPLTVDWAIYETRAGDTLAALAKSFGTTPAAIEAANRDLSIDWSNLPPWTLLRMPGVTTSVGATGPATLGEIARAFSLDPETLGWLNQEVKGIFAVTGAAVEITDEIVDATATVPPGVAGFQVERRELDPKSDEAALYLDASFHLLGWQLVENAGFLGGPQGLPVSPAEQLAPEELAQLQSERPAPAVPSGGALLSYEQLFPVGRYSKAKAPEEKEAPPAAGDPYVGIGSAAQPLLEWRDLFGNRARTALSDPALEPGGPANKPPVPVAYTDKLLGLAQWPSAAAHYGVGKGGQGPQVEVTIDLDASRYLTGSESARQLAEADRETYARAYYQLRQKAADGRRHVTIALSTTLDGGASHQLEGGALEAVEGFVREAWKFLDDLIEKRQATPPKEVAFAQPVAATNPADIFELTVTFSLTRDARWVAPDSRGEDGVAFVATTLPAIAASTEETASLEGFAAAFESAYAAAPVSLKLAVGTAREEEADPAGARRLWAVRVSSDLSAGIGAKVAGPAVYYAPPPLSTTLVSRNGVLVRGFDPETGGLEPGQGKPRDFSDVDLDVWARQALQAIDGILSPAYSVPAFIADAAVGANYLGRLREAKKALAKGIAGRVVNVLDQPAVKDPGPAPQDAREQWEQQLLITLSSAYQTDVAVQLPVEVRSSGDGSEEPPALYGHPAISEDQAERGTASTFKLSTESGSGFLTFMYTASDPTEQGSVRLDVDYQLDMIEHEIGAVPGIEGYRASSWLSFPIPLGSLPLKEPELARLDVPVVLRAYPTPPTLGEQATRPDLDVTDDRTKVQTAAHWTFLASYDQAHVAQDTIDAEAEFNIPGEGMKLNVETEKEDFFTTLARLLSVLPQLQEVFDTDLATVTTQTDKSSAVMSRAVNALAAFTELVEKVAAAWPAAATSLRPLGEVAESSSEFEIEETHYPLPEGEDLLVTVRSEKQPKDVPAPAIEIEGFPEAVPTEQGVRYRRDSGSPFLKWSEGVRIPGRTVAIGPLDGLAVQNARLGLQITRNAELVPQNATRSPFVYTTPQVRFPSICTPLLNSAVPIDVAAVATGSARQATMAEHLQALFQALLEKAATGTRKVQLQVSYSLPMGGELPPAVLPIKLGPAIEFPIPKGWEAGGLTEEVAKALLGWLSEHETAAGAELGFDLSIFSSLEATTLPLVRLSGLTLRLADVTDA